MPKAIHSLIEISMVISRHHMAQNTTRSLKMVEVRLDRLYFMYISWIAPVFEDEYNAYIYIYIYTTLCTLIKRLSTSCPYFLLLLLCLPFRCLPSPPYSDWARVLTHRQLLSETVCNI